ncbi:MAG TPA: hypothetical protein VFU01_10000 [Gemmatimonadaceae bacterium]|nr:hypothetical protein [Gemmatimonadaceae bacterium]
MSWVVIGLLGTYHGLNPAMGWLLATALGLQERRATAVMQALPPIFLGHAASVAVVISAAALAGSLLPADTLRWIGAAVLLGSSALVFRRRAHPRGGGMRLGPGGLVAWSFVMASSHGAGLMLLPALFGATHEHHGAPPAGIAVLLVHSTAMLLAMTTAALVAFHLTGVGALRRIWVDTDLVWSIALAVSGIVLLLT